MFCMKVGKLRTGRVCLSGFRCYSSQYDPNSLSKERFEGGAYRCGFIGCF